MINISFDKKVLAVSNSVYKDVDGSDKESQSLIIFDEDGYLKTPSLRFAQGVFEKLKLSDNKEIEKVSGKLCSISAQLSWSAKYGLSLNVLDVKPKA